MNICFVKTKPAFGLSALALLSAGLTAPALLAQGGNISVGPAPVFSKNNLIVSRSVYVSPKSLITVGQALPSCTVTAGTTPQPPCAVATADGGYPEVFMNEKPDSSFGVTSPLFIDQMTLAGTAVNTYAVDPARLVTSFPSKSEGALNLSTDRSVVSLIDYVSTPNQLDVSNSNTPGVIDNTNPVTTTPTYRGIATLDASGTLTITNSNAYSGNNGRAAIFNSAANVFYTSGNAGNGGKVQPVGVIAGAGSQIASPGVTPALPTPAGAFSPTEIPGNAADKIGKDTNFRGLTVYNNVVYLTKGSGGNGINTVYFIDTTGDATSPTSTNPHPACPSGVGLPVPGAALPTTPLPVNAATIQANGLPNNMCILKGFNTQYPVAGSNFNAPFGLFFASPTTLYVADEGDGVIADTPTSTIAGLQKWVFNSALNTWQRVYTLQKGLNLGVNYTVSGTDAAGDTGTYVPVATGGLRNITGLVGTDGTVAIYGVTSTVSTATDQGADPNKVVRIIDNIKNTNPILANFETFVTVQSAKYGEVLRGVSLTPGSDATVPSVAAAVNGFGH